MATAAIVTIGNEVVSGDTVNTNGSWLARRLEQLGVAVQLIAAVPDEIPRIAAVVREQAGAEDVVVVTGGLGGTPDDVTREAVAAAFDLPQEEVAEVAAALRARFERDPDYAARWARLPRGCRPLANPLGGAPGFAVENVYVLPGLPAEMEAMFETTRQSSRRARRSRRGGAATGRRRAGSRPSCARPANASRTSSSARTRASARAGPRWRSS